MTSLVSKDPETSADEALNEAVGSPRSGSDCEVGDRGDVCHGGPEKGPSQDNVADEVAHRSSKRRLKTMLRNCISQSVDIGILRQCRLWPANRVSFLAPTASRVSC